MHSDTDFLTEASAEYWALFQNLKDVRLDDELAFVQASEVTHVRIAIYHARIVASHRSLVRRFQAVFNPA